MPKSYLCVLLLPIVLLLRCTAAEAGAVPANTCIGYENQNFKGKSFIFKAPKTGTQSFNLSGALLKPDKTGNMSSIRCAATCVVDVWEKPDQGGVAAEFSGGARNLGKDWNDRAQSLTIGCGIQDELADGRNDMVREFACSSTSGTLALDHARLQYFIMGNWHMFSGRTFKPEKMEIARLETGREEYRSANAYEGDPVTTLVIRNEEKAELSIQGPNTKLKKWKCTVKYAPPNQGN
jgi:hypothetical protein